MPRYAGLQSERSVRARAYGIREAVEVGLLLAGLAGINHFVRVPTWVWIAAPLAKATSSMLFYLVFLRQSFRQKAWHDSSLLIGCFGEALDRLDPDGLVQIHGEMWRAQGLGSSPIPARSTVIVREVRGRALGVEEADDAGQPPCEQAAKRADS